MESKTLQGYVCAITGAVIYGCMPLMAKYIYAAGVNPLTLVFLRNFLCLPILAVLAYRKNKTLAIPKKALPSVAFLSLMGCTVTPILLMSSYRFIPSGTATIFHYVYPAIVVAVGILFLRQKVQFGNVAGVIMCVAGVCLFYTPGEPLDAGGSFLALLSGGAFAVYVLMLSAFKYKKEVSGFLFSFYVASVSSVCAFAVCAVTGSLALPKTLFGWGLCTLFSVSITTGAVVLFQRGAFMIGSERTSILGTLEPITSVLVGAVVFREVLSVQTIIGSALVIAASVLIAVLDMVAAKKNSI